MSTERKSIFKAITDWVLYTSVFAACCATGMSMATERLLTGNIPDVFTPLHIFIFGATLVIYNIHYLVKRSSSAISDRFSWTQRSRGWHYLFFAIGVLLCGINIFFLPVKILLACIILAVLSVAYSLPLLPLPSKRRLKDFGWIKILVLTGVWTIVTSILPMLYHDRAIADYPYEIMLRFVFMFTLCVAFDIRDMQTDLDANIYTLPNIIGVKNSYRVMYASLILFATLSIIQYLRYPSAERIVGELLTTACTFWAISYTKKHPSDKAYLAFVDGMMLAYALLLLLH